MGGIDTLVVRLHPKKNVKGINDFADRDFWWSYLDGVISDLMGSLPDEITPESYQRKGGKVVWGDYELSYKRAEGQGTGTHSIEPPMFNLRLPVDDPDLLYRTLLGVFEVMELENAISTIDAVCSADTKRDVIVYALSGRKEVMRGTAALTGVLSLGCAEGTSRELLAIARRKYTTGRLPGTHPHEYHFNPNRTVEITCITNRYNQ